MKSDVVRLRITPELKQKIKEAAERESRTVSNWIENIIKNNLLEEKPMEITHKNLQFAHEATNLDPGYSDLELVADDVKYLIRNCPAPKGWDGESDWTDDDDYIDQVIRQKVAAKEYDVYADGEWVNAK